MARIEGPSAPVPATPATAALAKPVGHDETLERAYRGLDSRPERPQAMRLGVVAFETSYAASGGVSGCCSARAFACSANTAATCGTR
jgi:hypothetical protein